MESQKALLDEVIIDITNAINNDINDAVNPGQALSAAGGKTKKNKNKKKKKRKTKKR